MTGHMPASSRGASCPSSRRAREGRTWRGAPWRARGWCRAPAASSSSCTSTGRWGQRPTGPCSTRRSGPRGWAWWPRACRPGGRPRSSCTGWPRRRCSPSTWLPRPLQPPRPPPAPLASPPSGRISVPLLQTRDGTYVSQLLVAEWTLRGY